MIEKDLKMYFGSLIIWFVLLFKEKEKNIWQKNIRKLERH